MPNSEESPRLNGPMVARLRGCAADTSSNWDGKITIYPPEARELVALIDAVRLARIKVAERLLAQRDDYCAGCGGQGCHECDDWAMSDTGSQPGAAS